MSDALTQGEDMTRTALADKIAEAKKLAQQVEEVKKRMAILRGREAAGRDLETSGKKFDQGKDPWHLAPWDSFREVVRILAFGASKYGERNWESGIKYSRLYAAAMRHLTAWFEGEDVDAETGRSHLAHAACCVCFMLAFVVRGRTELDDRPKQKQSFVPSASPVIADPPYVRGAVGTDLGAAATWLR